MNDNLERLDSQSRRALEFLAEKSNDDPILRKYLLTLANLCQALEIKQLKQEAKEAIRQIARTQLRATQLNSDLLYLHEVALRNDSCANQIRFLVKKIQSQAR
jgi:hypothetical protein